MNMTAMLDVLVNLARGHKETHDDEDIAPILVLSDGVGRMRVIALTVEREQMPEAVAVVAAGSRPRWVAFTTDAWMGAPIPPEDLGKPRPRPREDARGGEAMVVLVVDCETGDMRQAIQPYSRRDDGSLEWGKCLSDFGPPAGNVPAMLWNAFGRKVSPGQGPVSETGGR